MNICNKWNYMRKSKFNISIVDIFLLFSQFIFSQITLILNHKYFDFIDYFAIVNDFLLVVVEQNNMKSCF